VSPLTATTLLLANELLHAEFVKRRPAILLTDGEVIVGEFDQPHVEIVLSNSLAWDDIQDTGFIDTRGNFQRGTRSQEQGGAWAPAALKRVLARLIQAGLEERLPGLLKAFPQFGEAEIREAAEADPSLAKKYLSWIVRQVQAEQIRFPEDTEKVHEALSKFERLKNSPRFQAPKDIGQYRSYGDLADAIDSATGQESKKEKVRVKEVEGAQQVYDDGTYQVLKITTPESSAALCHGTDWCVKDPRFSKDYLKDGPLYLILKNGEKYVLAHPESRQYKDVRDREVGEKVIDEIRRPLIGIGAYTLEKLTNSLGVNLRHEYADHYEIDDLKESAIERTQEWIEQDLKWEEEHRKLRPEQEILVDEEYPRRMLGHWMEENIPPLAIGLFIDYIDFKDYEAEWKKLSEDPYSLDLADLIKEIDVERTFIEWLEDSVPHLTAKGGIIEITTDDPEEQEEAYTVLDELDVDDWYQSEYRSELEMKAEGEFIDRLVEGREKILEKISAELNEETIKNFIEWMKAEGYEVPVYSSFPLFAPERDPRQIDLPLQGVLRIFRQADKDTRIKHLQSRPENQDERSRSNIQWVKDNVRERDEKLISWVFGNYNGKGCGPRSTTTSRSEIFLL